MCDAAFGRRTAACCTPSRGRGRPCGVASLQPRTASCGLPDTQTYVKASVYTSPETLYSAKFLSDDTYNELMTCSCPPAASTLSPVMAAVVADLRVHARDGDALLCCATMRRRKAPKCGAMHLSGGALACAVVVAPQLSRRSSQRDQPGLARSPAKHLPQP